MALGVVVACAAQFLVGVDGLAGLSEDGWPREVTVRAEAGGAARAFRVRVRLDTATEAKYYRHGGILPFVARSVVAEGGAREVGADGLLPAADADRGVLLRQLAGDGEDQPPGELDRAGGV